MPSHQVKTWFGANVPGMADDPAVRSLAAKWLQVHAEREPTLADFWHDPDQAFADRAIVFLKGESDYTYLHHGRFLVERIGFSMQGRRLGELRTRIRPQLLEIYDRCTSGFVLTYFQSYADFQQDVILWGRLCLPLRISADDQRTAVLVYCHPIVDKQGMFRALFERTSAGFLIATAVRDERGRIADGWIVARNAEATRLAGVGEHAEADLLLRQIPLFRRDDLWNHLVQAMQGRVAFATLTDPARNLTLQLEGKLIEPYIVMRLIALPDTVQAFSLADAGSAAAEPHPS
jgi:hypothetical protein